MNTRITKVFDLAAISGLVCIGLLVFGLILMNLIEITLFGFNNPDFKGFYIVRPLFLTISLLFGACVFLLWVEACLWIKCNLNNRSLEINAALVLFMLIAPIFAGYIIHYYSRKKIEKSDFKQKINK